MSLTDDDLDYMREVQDEHRPTPATLSRRTEAPDGMGGTTYGDAGDAAQVTIRVAQADKVPDVIAERYGVGVVTVTLDLVFVTSGDRITVAADEVYEVVSDGALGAWATAQQVLAVRTVWPEGGA